MSKGYSAIASDGLVNLNGNVLCAIDVETTGFMAGYHDLIEVAVIPLNCDLKQHTKVMPFITKLHPKDRYKDSWTEEAERVHKISRSRLVLEGQDPWRAADRFEEWVQKLGLGPHKKVAPLGFNWPFDRSFLLDWLQPTTYDNLIWHNYRDAMPLVLALNDRAEMSQKDYPFPQTSLQNVRSRMGLPEQGAHTAVGDALVLIDVYRELMHGDWFKGEK